MSIQFKRSTLAGIQPAAEHLLQGELAINTADRLLFTKDHDNKIINVGFAKEYVDDNFLRLTGGIIKGRIQVANGLLPANSALDDLVSKRYVDSKFGTNADQSPTNTIIEYNYVPRSGTTMTGYLSVLQPTLSQHAVSKGYCDSTFLSKNGGVIGAPISYSGAINNASHLTNKAYVDQVVASGTASIDLSRFIASTGGNMTGPLTYSGAVSAATHLTTKAYVDTAITNSKTVVDTSNFVLKTGTTLTGHLAISAHPTSPSHLSNKSYVDSAINASQSANLISVLKAVYPVGCIFVTTMAQSPSTVFGFGSWVAAGNGRVLVGAGNTVDTRGESKTFTAGTQGGEFNHQLIVAEMPSHAHAVAKDRGGNQPLSALAGGGGDEQPTGESTASAGGDQAHNNIQPYLVVYMWKRLA